MQKEEDVSLMFDQSPDNRDIKLNCTSKKIMTKDDYINLIEDFIEGLKDGTTEFLPVEVDQDLH